MQQVTKKKGGGSKNLLNDVFFKYLPFWPFFIATIMISIGAGWFYLRTAVPKYETTASIMLKDETKGTYDGPTVDKLNPLEDKKIIENEVKVLQSRTLMQDVVKRLHLYAAFFEESDLKALPAYTTSPVMIQALYPEKLRPAKKVLFTFNEKDSTVIIGKNKYALNQPVNTE